MRIHPWFPGALAALLVSATAPCHAGLLSLFEFEGHTYEVWGDDRRSNDERPYLEAAAFAASRDRFKIPGYLVRVDSDGENARLIEALNAISEFWGAPVPDGGGARYAWIGADDLDEDGADGEGRWKWRRGNVEFWVGGANGASVGGLYENWAVGRLGVRSEPDSFQGRQDAAAMALEAYPVFQPGLLGQPGQWNDLDAGNVLPFIVEYDPAPVSPGIIQLDLDGPDGTPQINVPTQDGVAYRLETSTTLSLDLEGWAMVEIFEGDGSVRVLDGLAGQGDIAFYRVVLR